MGFIDEIKAKAKSCKKINRSSRERRHQNL